MRSIFATAYILSAVFPAAAQERGDPQIGLEIAREACSVCHAVNRVEDRSPNPNAPTFGAIASVPGMSATALQLATTAVTALADERGARLLSVFVGVVVTQAQRR